MSKKLRNACTALLCAVALPIRKLFHWSSFSYSGLQLISPRASLRFDGGKLCLGARTVIEPNSAVIFSGKINIGKGVYINRNTIINAHEQITVGDHSTIGPGVFIYDHDHDIQNRGQYLTSPVTIGNNVWIGAGAIILRGVTLGDNSVVAAGTVVCKDVPADTVVRTQFSYHYTEKA